MTRNCSFYGWQCTGWGGQSWTKKVFFRYRDSCLSEAYCMPEKCSLVCAGLSGNHLLNLNLIFLSNSVKAVVEQAADFAVAYCH